MADDNAWTPMQKASFIVTLVVLVLLSLLAWASVDYGWLLWLAASVGGLGGLTHEIAQSGGTIAFFQKHEDGLYLGTLAGVILGAVAGIMVVRGYLVPTASGTAASYSMAQVSYLVFTAGLALKGVVEAAGGNVVTKT
ncbi:MAG: hypothetical protein P8Z30_08690 [Acidobacteriota bacterium]